MNNINLVKSNARIGQFDVFEIDPGVVVGCELGKRRRYIVISNDVNNNYSDTITVVPIKDISERLHRYEIYVKCGEMNLWKNSKIVIPQILTVRKNQFINRHRCIGKVPLYLQEKIQDKLIEFISYENSLNEADDQIKQNKIYEINLSTNQSFFSQADLTKVIVISNNFNNSLNKVVTISPMEEYDTTLKSNKLDIYVTGLLKNEDKVYIAYPEKIRRVAKERFFIDGRIRKIGELNESLIYSVKNSLLVHFGFTNIITNK